MIGFEKLSLPIVKRTLQDGHPFAIWAAASTTNPQELRDAVKEIITDAAVLEELPGRLHRLRELYEFRENCEVFYTAPDATLFWDDPEQFKPHMMKELS